MTRSRNSTMTEFSLRLSEDAVDRNGVARMEFLPSGPVNDDANIAPWIDIPVRAFRSGRPWISLVRDFGTDWSNSPPHRPNHPRERLGILGPRSQSHPSQGRRDKEAMRTVGTTLCTQSHRPPLKDTAVDLWKGMQSRRRARFPTVVHRPIRQNSESQSRL
jgi:hypothetical protein